MILPKCKPQLYQKKKSIDNFFFTSNIKCSVKTNRQTSGGVCIYISMFVVYMYVFHELCCFLSTLCKNFWHNRHGVTQTEGMQVRIESALNKRKKKRGENSILLAQVHIFSDLATKTWSWARWWMASSCANVHRRASIWLATSGRCEVSLLSLSLACIVWWTWWELLCFFFNSHVFIL